MPGAGTDKTKDWAELPGPMVVLVEPQLGENIGAAARASPLAQVTALFHRRTGPMWSISREGTNSVFR
jgi:hypothetical protein